MFYLLRADMLHITSCCFLILHFYFKGILISLCAFYAENGDLAND